MRHRAGKERLPRTGTDRDIFPARERPNVVALSLRSLVRHLVWQDAGIRTPPAGNAEDAQTYAREPSVLCVQLIPPLALKGWAME